MKEDLKYLGDIEWQDGWHLVTCDVRALNIITDHDGTMILQALIEAPKEITIREEKFSIHCFYLKDY